MARKKKSSGCLSTLFFLPISLAFALAWYIFKIMLYVTFYLTLFVLCLIWYIVSGLFGLIFHKSQFHAKCNSGEEYEQICCQKLRQHGFTHIQTTPRTGDHGIDILAKRAGKKYAIQCKYYSSSVGNHAVQEAFSGCAYYGYDIPVVLTNNIFTQNAIDEARKLGVQLWSQNKIPFSDKSFFNNLFKRKAVSQQSSTDTVHFDIISEAKISEQPIKSSIDSKLEKNKSITADEYVNIIEKIIEKPVDFSHDGMFLDKMSNMVITQISDQTKNDLLDDLIRYNTCKTLCIILFDKNKFNFFAYKDAPNLLVPVISESNKLHDTFKWACNEMDKRTDLFLNHKVKNIFDYNKKATSESFPVLPLITIIIDELYGSYDIFTDELDSILLDSGRRGVFIIGFSRLELKRLNLGSTDFLWKKYIDSQISGMFTLPRVSNQQDKY